MGPRSLPQPCLEPGSHSFLLDKTASPATVTVTARTDPVKNNWVLGAGSDAEPGTVANEGYGAEVRWSLSDLQSRGLLIPGHNYRFYVIIHDGDQNKTGGDAGQASFQYNYPGVINNSPATLSGKVVEDIQTSGDGFRQIDDGHCS